MNPRSTIVPRLSQILELLVDIREDGFDFHLDGDKVSAEAALDGIYVVRTSVPAHRLPTDEVVRSYKRLSQVERAFRSLKTLDLKVRPIRHRLEDRVKAHIFLCMLAHYVAWHMLEAWRSLLFYDEDQQAKTTRDPVAPATRSKAALDKVQAKILDDGTPVHSFQTLLKDLATIVSNTCRRPRGIDSWRAHLQPRHHPKPDATAHLRSAQVDPTVARSLNAHPGLSYRLHREMLPVDGGNFSLINQRAGRGESKTGGSATSNHIADFSP